MSVIKHCFLLRRRLPLAPLSHAAAGKSQGCSGGKRRPRRKKKHFRRRKRKVCCMFVGTDRHKLGLAPWVCSAHPSGAGNNKEVTSAWSNKTALHPAGSRGHSVTSVPRWAVGAMQSVGRRVWTNRVSIRRADLRGESHGHPGLGHKWSIWRKQQRGRLLWPSCCLGSLLPHPQDNLAEHPVSRPSPLLEVSLIIQRSQ